MRGEKEKISNKQPSMDTYDVSLFRLAVSVLFLTTIASSDVEKRYLFNGVPREDCILCKCYNECFNNELRLCNTVFPGIRCSDVNRCTCCEHHPKRMNPCLNGGQCRNERNGAFSCDCLSGYSGNTCENHATMSNLCTSSPCKNGGNCVDDSNRYLCTCPVGWKGQNCETDIDECASLQPCKNGATCTNTPGHYQCSCVLGWTGDDCDLDACHINQCGTHGHCEHQDTFPFYHCNCTDGHFGKHCESSVK